MVDCGIWIPLSSERSQETIHSGKTYSFSGQFSGFLIQFSGFLDNSLLNFIPLGLLLLFLYIYFTLFAFSGGQKQRFEPVLCCNLMPQASVKSSRFGKLLSPAEPQRNFGTQTRQARKNFSKKLLIFIALKINNIKIIFQILKSLARHPKAGWHIFWLIAIRKHTGKHRKPKRENKQNK